MQDSEKSREQLIHELEEAKQKYNSIFEESGDSIIISDLITSNIVDANKNALRRFGYTRDELLQLTINDIEILHHVESATSNSWESTFSGTQIYECHYRHKDGTLIPVEVSSRLSQHNEQRVFHHFIRDISIRKTAEAQRLELILEQKRTEILTKFITQASHEFRTPLSIINSSAYLIQKTDDPDKLKKQVDNIENQVMNLTTLVDKLVAMAKLDGIRTLESQPVDLSRLVTSLVEDRRKLLHRQDVEIILELNKPSIVLQANVDYLMQAIEAILDNALNFTHTGKIVVILSEEGGKALIEIIDSGIGIAEEHLSRIFERFYRVDDIGKTRGFGLGLPIAKRIIELHHGQIKADSKIGEGSSFRIILPIAAASP